MAVPRRSILTTAKSESLLSGRTNLPAHTIQLNLRSHQAEVMERCKRFTVLLAHRRFGKTVSAVAKAIVQSRVIPHTRPQVHYFAPTFKQVKAVAWQYVHELAEPLGGCKFSETELSVRLPWGATLTLGSAEDPDRNRGIYSDFTVLDEPAQMHPAMWREVIRPALSDREGGAMFIGTPAGRHGMFYELYRYALEANDPEWVALTYRADETGVIPDRELQSLRRTMQHAEYEQEYLCSWDAMLVGAYWAETIGQLDRAGHISPSVLHYPARPVHVVMDLGINDATACWFFQVDQDAVRVIAYAEYRNRSLPEIVADWRLRPYTYGKVIAPHDANNRSLSTGETRAQLLRSLGCDVIVMERLPVSEGIEAVRLFLPRCYFNATACRDGLEALRQYRSDWEEQKGVLSLRPVHDWTSHGADAMRYLATCGLHRLEASGGALNYGRLDRGRVA